MDLNQYVKDAIRTESTIDKVEVHNSIKQVMEIFVAAGNMLDYYKKNIYYNKTIDPIVWREQIHTILNTAQHLPLSPQPESTEFNFDTRLFHAIIGIATEGAELIEAILKSDDGNIDIVNVKEEMFDVLWYILIGHDTMESNPTNTLNMGFEKLRLRYPDKFTSDDAINRDIEAEREILESHS